MEGTDIDKGLKERKVIPYMLIYDDIQKRGQMIDQISKVLLNDSLVRDIFDSEYNCKVSNVVDDLTDFDKAQLKVNENIYSLIMFKPIVLVGNLQALDFVRWSNLIGGKSYKSDLAFILNDVNDFSLIDQCVGQGIKKCVSTLNKSTSSQETIDTHMQIVKKYEDMGVKVHFFYEPKSLSDLIVPYFIG